MTSILRSIGSCPELCAQVKTHSSGAMASARLVESRFGKNLVGVLMMLYSLNIYFRSIFHLVYLRKGYPCGATLIKSDEGDKLMQTHMLTKRHEVSSLYTLISLEIE
jgi:hypothetical protein